MRILPVSLNYYNSNKQSHLYDKTSHTTPAYNRIPASYPAFKWCLPHLEAMDNINKKFQQTVSTVVKQEEKLKGDISRKNELKNTRYSLLDTAAAQASQLFAQYCNMQYTVAEMLPEYAMRNNASLSEAINKLSVLNDPVSTLIALNNVAKLNMRAGIDKNTGKQYTKEQTERAKSGTQLYTAAFLLKKLGENIAKTADSTLKQRLQNLFIMANNSLEEIYGKNVLQRIQELSNIEGEPTLEQKKASIALIAEFDEKGKPLTFSDEFKTALNDLIDSENLRLGKTMPNRGKGLPQAVNVQLAYHTHAQGEEHVHEHSHEHEHHHHEHMSEEEHRLYHQKEQERLHNNQ